MSVWAGSSRSPESDGSGMSSSWAIRSSSATVFVDSCSVSRLTWRSRCARRSLCRVRLFWLIKDKEREKDRLQGDDEREETEGKRIDGSPAGHERGVPGDPRRAPHDVDPREPSRAGHPRDGVGEAFCRARSAASSWATASTFRARSGEACARSFGDPFCGVGIGVCGRRRPATGLRLRCALPFPAPRSRVSGSLRASRGSDRLDGRSPSASGPSGTP